jgi:hypothetical protein
MKNLRQLLSNIVLENTYGKKAVFSERTRQHYMLYMTESSIPYLTFHCGIKVYICTTSIITLKYSQSNNNYTHTSELKQLT